jgi:uncharacterized protein (DUF4415 family)
MKRTKTEGKKRPSQQVAGKIVRVNAPELERLLRSDKIRKEIEVVAALPPRPIDYDDLEIPEITDEQWKRFVPGRWLMFRATKRKVTLKLDGDVIDWLNRSKSGGRDWIANRILRYQMCLAYKDRLEYAREKGRSAHTRKSGMKA